MLHRGDREEIQWVQGAGAHSSRSWVQTQHQSWSTFHFNFFIFYRRFNFLYLTFFFSFYYFCTCPEDSAPVPGVGLPSSAGELPRESRAGIWGNYCCFVLAHLNLLGIHERRFIGQLRLAVSRNLKRQTGTRLHLFLSQGLHFGEVRSMAPPDCFNRVAVILCFLSLTLGESFMFTYTIYLRVKEQTFWLIVNSLQWMKDWLHNI